MTREGAIKSIQDFMGWFKKDKPIYEALEMAIKSLSVEPCEDCVSRAEALKNIALTNNKDDVYRMLTRLSPVTPKQEMGHCKDCKWWKDSDGLYRRGCHAESQCPINRREVFEGNGYCYMFEPQVQEVEENG